MTTNKYDFVEELNKHKGFTLTSSNGVLWVTKLRNKSMSLLYKPKGKNYFYSIGIIKDVKAFKEFFKGCKTSESEE